MEVVCAAIMSLADWTGSVDAIREVGARTILVVARIVTAYATILVATDGAIAYNLRPPLLDKRLAVGTMVVYGVVIGETLHLVMPENASIMRIMLSAVLVGANLAACLHTGSGIGTMA